MHSQLRNASLRGKCSGPGPAATIGTVKHPMVYWYRGCMVHVDPRRLLASPLRVAAGPAPETLRCDIETSRVGQPFCHSARDCCTGHSPIRTVTPIGAYQQCHWAACARCAATLIGCCHATLQELLARWLNTEECIIYSYDLATIPSVVPAFATKKDVIVVDEVGAWQAFL